MTRVSVTPSSGLERMREPSGSAAGHVSGTRTVATNETRIPRRPRVSRILAYLVLLTILLSVLYPMFWLFCTSLKTDRDVFTRPFALPHFAALQWGNFTRAWTTGRFGVYFVNSVAVTLLTVAATTLLSAMTAYALSRFAFRGLRPIFFVFLAGLM